MNKYIFHILIILCLCFSRSMAGIQFGLHAGVSRTALSGDVPEDASYLSKYGFIGTLSGEIPVTEDVNLYFGLQYLEKGTSVGYEVPKEKELRDSLSLSLKYISLPILMRVYSSNGKTYVSGGFDLGFLQDGRLKDVRTGSERDVTGWFKDIDISMCLGFGIMIPIDVLKLNFELKYVQSILSIGDLDGMDLQTGVPVRIRTNGFQFHTGIVFGI
jgi:hypothetical protein